MSQTLQQAVSCQGLLPPPTLVIGYLQFPFSTQAPGHQLLGLIKGLIQALPDSARISYEEDEEEEAKAERPETWGIILARRRRRRRRRGYMKQWLAKWTRSCAVLPCASFLLVWGNRLNLPWWNWWQTAANKATLIGNGKQWLCRHDDLLAW